VPPRPGRCGCGTGLLVSAPAALAAVKMPPAAVAANNVRRATSSMASVLERIGTWQISPNLNRHGTLIVINFAY
jgi:hypothetical protein